MPPRDLSGQEGNPTWAIQQNYDALMSITDPEQLKQAAIDLVKPYVGQAMSENNWRKFMMAIERTRTIQEIQFFLTNFLLKGSQLGVLRNSVEGIANFITEDIDQMRQRFTPEQAVLVEMVGRYGFQVTHLV